jgi:hypothetical protein
MNDFFTLIGRVVSPRLSLAVSGVFAALAGLLCVMNGGRVEGLLWRGVLLIAGGMSLVVLAARGGILPKT